MEISTNTAAGNLSPITHNAHFANKQEGFPVSEKTSSSDQVFISDEAKQLNTSDKAEKEVISDEQSKLKGHDQSSSSPSGEALTEEEQRQLDELKNRDAEVKAHEQAHLSASGGLVRSGAQFTYENGPDGKRYAVGGEVSIDTSKVSGDPQATMLKAQKIRRAALAPADPSSQDRAIAADATSMEAQARTELSQQSSEEQTESAAGKGSETNLSVSDIQQNEKNIRESYQKIQPDQLQQSIHNHVNYFI